MPRSRLTEPNGLLGPAQEAELRALIDRRAGREPLQYVLGEWGFRHLTLAVDRRALIPRPETEVLVDRCLALLEGVAAPRILDVGTGSGAIALALADEVPDATIVAVDASAEALALAAANAERTGLAARIDLRLGNLLEPADGTFDLVASNPPYVPLADRADDAAGDRRLGARRGALRPRPDGRDRARRRATTCGPAPPWRSSLRTGALHASGSTSRRTAT